MGWTKIALGLTLSVATAACLFPTSDEVPDDVERADAGCTSDSACPTSTVPCTESHCVNGACVTTNTPAGVAVTSSAYRAECKRFVCDGQGSARPEPDPTAVPSRTAGACRRYQCSAAGEPEIVVDPTVVDPGSVKDCKRNTCDASGAIRSEVDVNDVPADTDGDCKRETCNSNGTVGKVNDDTDVPTSFCKAYTCSNGTATGRPQNVGAKCDPHGYACSAGGECNVCFKPDASCTDLGPGAGARSPSAPHDWRGIGHCDNGGRAWCGAINSGSTAYFKYNDNNTGFLCEFDPRITFTPTATAKVCQLFSCATAPSCPGGWTASTEGAYKGCCATVGATGIGAAIPYCRNADVLITVTTSQPCVGYRLSFNQ